MTSKLLRYVPLSSGTLWKVSFWTVWNLRWLLPYNSVAGHLNPTPWTILQHSQCRIALSLHMCWTTSYFYGFCRHRTFHISRPRIKAALQYKLRQLVEKLHTRRCFFLRDFTAFENFRLTRLKKNRACLTSIVIITQSMLTKFMIGILTYKHM